MVDTASHSNFAFPAEQSSFSWWELLGLGVAVAGALVMGFANSGVPSLWHDEAVHVMVSKNFLELGRFEHLGGEPYQNANTFNAILAGFIALFGDAERVVRAPSTLFAAANVVLVFVLVRPLLGRATALVTALALAFSPWSVAWSREARFYEFQQFLYLLLLWTVWRALTTEEAKTAAKFAAAGFVAFVLAIFTSFHSLLFLSGVGCFGLFILARERRWKSRAMALCVAVAVLSAATMGTYAAVLTTKDQIALFEHSGLGGELVEEVRADRFYYFRWLEDNLSTGYFVLALLGLGLMAVREKGRGVYTALAFLVPLIMLTYFIGYRRPRFMHFAFPLYVAAFSYALVVLGEIVLSARQSRLRLIGAILIGLFGMRLAVSTVSLVGDSVETASGAHVTLARRHPQWRAPCLYVRDRLGDAALLTTTCLPVYYYVGRVDNWYPSRDHPWEWVESGLEGLENLEELKAFVARHPVGYFIAEWWRFERNAKSMAEELVWVDENMTRIDEASTKDVTVYRWGTAGPGNEAGAGGG